MASTGEVWRLGRRPALDGLRGVAVLMVMVGHAWPEHAAQIAMAGVGMFFTLSGFLITALLLEERARAGRVSLVDFYRRRALRLAPAAAVFLLVFAVLTALTGIRFLSWAQALPVLLYLENWVIIATGPTGIVNHFWSLSVEEQFYLLWPALMLVGLRLHRRALLALIGLGAVASMVVGRLLIAGHASAERVAYGLDTNAVALLLGCGLAVVMHRSRVARARPLLALAAVGAILSFYFQSTMWQLPIVPVLTVVAIYALTAGEAPAWLQPGWLVLVGRRSYALYLWHVPLAFGLLLNPLRGHVSDWVAVPIFVLVSWVFATLSWHLVERPFVALKQRQETRSKHAQAGIPARVVDPEPLALKI